MHIIVSRLHGLQALLYCDELQVVKESGTSKGRKELTLEIWGILNFSKRLSPNCNFF